MKLFKKNTQGSALTTVIGGVVIVLAVLFLLVKLAGSGYYSDVSDDTSSATETRIMPSGRLVEGDGTEPGQRTGKQVFDKVCVQCHAADSTIAFAPKVTHNDQWAARIAQGLNVLVEHAVKGFSGADGGVMPAKGGDQTLTDEEVARAVAYMANQSGAHFDESGTAGNNAAAASGAAASGAAVASGTAASASAAGGDSKPADTAAANGRGKELFEKSCAACHGATAAIPFAPKVTNREDWAPRIKQGEETLFKHAIEGLTNPKGGVMPPKGGSSLSDDEIKDVVRYMVQQSGG